MLLFCYIDAYTGLEFYSELLRVDRDAPDELLYELFIELVDVGLLFDDEILQFLNPVHGLVPAMVIELRLGFHFLQAEHLVGDGIVVLATFGLVLPAM